MLPHDDIAASPPTAPTGRGRYALAAVLVIVAVALALRLHAATRFGLELDDFWNAQLSTGRGTVHESIEINRIHVPPAATSLQDAPPWWSIPGTLENVTHPPLFSIVLRWWRAIFGEGDLAMRAFGAVLSAAAIVPIALTALMLSGRAAALWTAILLAVATVPIMVAQEVRPYNLMLLLGALAGWQAVRMTRRGAGWAAAAGFAVTSLAAMLTHYFAAPMLAMLWLFTARLLDRRAGLRLAACIAAAAAIYLAAWGPMLLKQRAEMRESASIWLKDPSPHPPLATLSRMCEVPIRLMMTPMESARRWTQLGIMLVLAAAVLAVRPKRQDLRFWLAMLAGTLGFVALVDLGQQTRMLGLLRYSLPAAPAVAAIMACLLADSRPWLRHIVPAVAAAAAVLTLPRAYERNWPDYRPLAAFLDSRVDQRDIVVFARPPGAPWLAGLQYVAWMHYSRSRLSDGDLWPRCAFIDAAAPPAMADELREAEDVWVVSFFDPADGVDRIPGLVAAERVDFPRVGVVIRATFAPGPPNP